MSVQSFVKQSFAALAVAVATASSANTISAFDTLGPSNSFSAVSGWGVGSGNNPGANLAPLMKFTAGASGTLVSADIAIDASSCCAVPLPPMTLRLLTDANGAPGQLLTTTGGVPLPATPQVVSGTFAGGLQITSGTTYWFGVMTDEADAGSASWWLNTLGVNGDVAISGFPGQQPGEWFVNFGVPFSAFRINVASPVNEPATALLFALGAIPLALRLQARRARTGR